MENENAVKKYDMSDEEYDAIRKLGVYLKCAYLSIETLSIEDMSEIIQSSYEQIKELL